MKNHNPELVSALLDGELRGVRRWLTTRHVSRCAICATEYRHLQDVQQMLAANPPTAEMSDSPEYFWSKVKAEIERRGPEQVRAPIPHLSAWDWLGQHQFAMSGVATLLVAAVITMSTLYGNRPGGYERQYYASVESLETVIPDTVATVVDTDDPGAKVIWVSGLPWVRDLDELKALFDPEEIIEVPDEMDT